MSRRKRRVYAAMMILGAIAMVVDRVALSGADAVAPDPTRKNHQPEAGVNRLTAAAAPPTTSQPPANLPIPEVPFPRGVEDYASAMPVRDLFARVSVAGSTGGASPDKDDTHAGLPGRASALSSAVFSARRRLHAVIMLQRLRIAVVDGKWVRVGQVIDGCELRSLSGNQARFICHDGDAILIVDAPRVPEPG